ncbi:UNVERIFIED_CONTAM: cyclophilin-like fold protein [Kocuria sp. CPCC 205274]
MHRHKLRQVQVSRPVGLAPHPAEGTPVAEATAPALHIRPTVVMLLAVLAATLTACNTSGPIGSSPEPYPASSTATTENNDDMSTPSAAEGTPITLDIEDTTVTGTLSDNTAARSLIDQLPLELSFTDYGGQEKIADLPAPLSLEGMPAGDDAEPLTIGYYAPDQALVLYYEHVGYYNGIVRLGEFEDVEAVRDHDDEFTAHLSLAD